MGHNMVHIHKLVACANWFVDVAKILVVWFIQRSNGRGKLSQVSISLLIYRR